VVAEKTSALMPTNTMSLTRTAWTSKLRRVRSPRAHRVDQSVRPVDEPAGHSHVALLAARPRFVELARSFRTDPSASGNEGNGNRSRVMVSEMAPR